MELTKLTEELKLAKGRSNASTTHATEVQQQLQMAHGKIASLQEQLGQLQEGEAKSTAAHDRWQQDMKALQADLHRLTPLPTHTPHTPV
jgi:peptidoglycan hydrolase CwlO-like protein